MFCSMLFNNLKSHSGSYNRFLMPLWKKIIKQIAEDSKFRIKKNGGFDFTEEKNLQEKQRIGVLAHQNCIMVQFTKVQVIEATFLVCQFHLRLFMSILF